MKIIRFPGIVISSGSVVFGAQNETQHWSKLFSVLSQRAYNSLCNFFVICGFCFGPFIGAPKVKLATMRRDGPKKDLESHKVLKRNMCEKCNFQCEAIL